MTRALLSLALISVLAACGCPWATVLGSGTVVTETTVIPDFSKVEIQDGFSAEIVYGQSYQITVTADDNILDYVGITRRTDTLVFFLQEGLSYAGLSSLHAVIEIPQLSGVRLSGASRATIEGFSSLSRLLVDVYGASSVMMTAVSTGDIDVSVHGASEVALANVSCSDVDIMLSSGSVLDGSVTASGRISVDVSTASELNLSGSGGDLSLEASGASNVDLGDFEVIDADVEAHSASTVTVKMDGTLDCDLTGASTLYYAGRVVMGQVSVSDSSNLREW